MYFCIDTSYTIFYRFHALQTWAGLALKDSSDTETEEAIQAKFREKYLETMLNICKKIYIESRKGEIEKSEIEKGVEMKEDGDEGKGSSTLKKNAKKIKKKKMKFNQEEHTFLWCRDTDRSSLWRTELFPEYKGNRQNDTGVGSFFSDTYQNILGPFIEANPNHHLLRLERLEADDMIYLTCKHLVETRREEYTHIAIVTSDHDLLQIKKLESPNYRISFWKCQKGGSHWTSKSGDPDFDLFCKIIGGDPSDNIKSCFKGVGKKTIQKIFKDQSLFDTYLAKSEEDRNRYLLNQTLIDFRNIPEHYQVSALTIIKNVFSVD